MALEMNPTLAELFRASNAHDAEAYAACFSEDAQVGDDGEVHRGRPAIRAWAQQTFAEYNQISEVTKVVAHEDETVVTAIASGTFPGSPIEFDYHFRMAGDKIASLVIR